MQWLKLLSISLISVFAPIVPMIIATIVLIILDLITGVWSSLKKGKVIASACFRRTVTKTAVYQIALITSFIVETYLVGNSIPITKITSSIIGLVEISSIFENLNSIYGTNIFKKILLILGSPNDPQNCKDVNCRKHQ
jgi:hypothetical protein